MLNFEYLRLTDSTESHAPQAGLLTSETIELDPWHNQPREKFYGFLLFPIIHVSKMSGNTVQKLQSSIRTIISTVQISFGFSDTPASVGYLKIFSLIRGLSPTRKSEKRVFFEIVWTSMVYLLLLNCTHRARIPVMRFLIDTRGGGGRGHTLRCKNSELVNYSSLFSHVYRCIY